MKPPTSGFFHSRRRFEYRLLARGALVSNVGGWVQVSAED